jgi:hypothetical protein
MALVKKRQLGYGRSPTLDDVFNSVGHPFSGRSFGVVVVLWLGRIPWG